MKLNYTLEVKDTIVELTCKDFKKIAKEIDCYEFEKSSEFRNLYVLQGKSVSDAFNVAAEIAREFERFVYKKPTKPVTYKNSNDAFAYEVTAKDSDVTLKILKMHVNLVNRHGDECYEHGHFGKYDIKSTNTLEIYDDETLYLCGEDNEIVNGFCSGEDTKTFEDNVEAKKIAKEISESLNLFMESDHFKKFRPLTKFEHLTVYSYKDKEYLFTNSGHFFDMSGNVVRIPKKPELFKFVREVSAT